MRLITRPALCVGLAFVLTLVWVPTALGQGATTGAIVGQVVDPDGVALPGATITVIHEPTGTRYTGFARSDGRFAILNVRVGGPYTVTTSLQGFREVTEANLTVNLGEELALDFTLQLANVTETITVTAVSDLIINPSHTGAQSNISLDTIESLPTLERSLEDFARLDPFFTPQAADNEGQSAISVAGRNNRYNNIQIDGSVNNDLFGLAATGTPGGQTEVQPISLDAIQELQLVVSPYDVRQGGFSGGGINAITRSGTNTFHGSGYFFNRSNGLVGNGPNDLEFGKFTDRVGGGRVGGPILADKLFFFGNFEVVRRNKPSGFSADGSSGQDFGLLAEAQRFRDILINSYGHDPGGLEEFGRGTESNQVFVRIDANIADRHRLTVRHNYVDGDNQIMFQGSSLYRFPDNFYFINIDTNSSVVQLNSTVGTDLYNELRFTYQTIKGPRFGPDPFPAVEVFIPGTGKSFRAGTERFSTANNLDQVIFELSDDLTFNRGSHTVTLGTHNEFFEFDNLFIRENFGSYQFQNLDEFEQGLASSFNYSFSATDDPKQSARFDVRHFSFYAGDDWAATDRLTLTYGLRLDIPTFPDAPTRNSDSELFFDKRTDIVPSGNVLWSPRLGFNLDVLGDGTQQLRGGVGLFSGRTPYVWMSNQYGNTGIEFTRVSAGSSSGDTCQPDCLTFFPDPFDQPEDVGGAATNEIDLIDPDYKFPSVLRTTVGYDRELGLQDLTSTVEFVYSNTVNDILYQNLNFAPDGGMLFDGRPTQERVEGSLRDVIYLTNTNDGWQYNAVFKVQRPWLDGWMAQGSYMYGDSRSINDGNSSQARSNWRFLYIVDPNDPGLARSDYSVGHRVNFTFAKDFTIRDRARVALSLFYDGQSGRPYSTTFRFDENGDFESNDLMFVPASTDDVIIQGGTPEEFDAFLSETGLDQYRGEILPRNAARAPWRNFTDVRAAVQVPIRDTEVEFTLDIINFLNLLNSDWGKVQFVFFDELSPVSFDGIDSATGKPIYSLQSFAIDEDSRYTLDDLRSRWQLKLGARVSF